MNACVPKCLRNPNPLPTPIASTRRRKLSASWVITPVFISFVFATMHTIAQPAIAQDKEPTGQWIKMTPSGAMASFEMPKNPRYVERSFSPIPNKPPIKVRLYLATVATENRTYVFSYHDLHETPQDKKTAKAALDGAVKGSVLNVLGQLVDPQELGLKNPQAISYEGRSGRQFVCRFIQNEKTFIVTARIFLVDKRLYQLSCIMAEPYDPLVPLRFLKSFEIVVPENDLPPRPRMAKTQ